MVRSFLFDLLWDNGRDLTGKGVVQRRERLQEVITPVAGIQVGGYLDERGVELFRLAKEKGLEGIIAKRKSSTYQPGRRSSDWLKIKARPQQEFVVGGFTEGKGSLRCNDHVAEFWRRSRDHPSKESLTVASDSVR